MTGRWCRPEDPEHGPQCRRLGPDAKEAQGWGGEWPPGECENYHCWDVEDEERGWSPSALDLDQEYWDEMDPRPPAGPLVEPSDLLLEEDVNVEEKTSGRRCGEGAAQGRS